MYRAPVVVGVLCDNEGSEMSLVKLFLPLLVVRAVDVLVWVRKNICDCDFGIGALVLGAAAGPGAQLDHVPGCREGLLAQPGAREEIVGLPGTFPVQCHSSHSRGENHACCVYIIKDALSCIRALVFQDRLSALWAIANSFGWHFSPRIG